MNAELIEARRSYLNQCTDVGKILEEYHDDEMSEFVVSTAGDVTVYRVYGKKFADFYCVCK